jgi:hypothetical protein
VDNDGANKWDFLGMWKNLKREKKAWAEVCAEKDDTWEGLAKLLHFDTFEADKWIRNYDGPWPDEGKTYSVPNTIAVYAAKRDIWPAMLPTHVETVALWTYTWPAALAYKDLGYNVIEEYAGDSADTYNALWKQDGIAGVIFQGHGRMLGWGPRKGNWDGFYSQPSNGSVSSPNTVVPPYKLSVIMAFTCGGYESGWQRHLSSNRGLFIAFSGEITGNDLLIGGNGKVKVEFKH